MKESWCMNQVKHLIKLECYKLLKDILGIEEYKPFKMYW